MKEKNKIYTAADFARYHAGTMPARDMHALEKAALEDPFLEDALEGYVHTTAFDTDIIELQSRLAEKRSKKNVFLISAMVEKKWWRVAAIFFVIAGAGYLFYEVNDVTKNNPIAKLEKNIATDNVSNASPLPGDVTLSSDSVFESRQAVNEQNEKRNLIQPGPSIEKGHFDSIGAESSLASAPLKKSTSIPNPNPAYFEKTQVENDRRSKAFALKSDVIDDKSDAASHTSVADNTPGGVPGTDASKNLKLSKHDADLTTVNSGNVLAPKSSIHTKDTPAAISPQNENAPLAKQKTIGDAADGNKAALLKETETKVPGLPITPARPQLSTDQKKFDKYLQDNAVPLFNDKGDRLIGEVSLTFTTTRQGKPENIKIVTSSCPGCEKAAVKLLEKGPHWTGKKGEPGKVVIKF